MPLTQPAYLPASLLSFEKVRNLFGDEILGRALSGEELTAIAYDPGGNFLPMMSRFWREQHGKIIMDRGFIPSAIAWQIGIPNGGEDISIYFYNTQIETFMNKFSDDQENIKSEEKAKGGRPPADWDAVFIAAACHIAVEGLPKTQAAFVSAIQSRIGDNAPGDTQMKERIGPLYRAVKKALDGSET